MEKALKISGLIFLLFIGGFSAAKIKPHVYPSQCVGCGDCVSICPKSKDGAITIIDGKAVINPEVCIACNQCVYICSFEAVKK